MTASALAARFSAWLPAEPEAAAGSRSLGLAQVLTCLMFLYYAGEAGFPFMAFAPLSVALLMGAIVWPGLRASPLLWLYLALAVVWARLPVLLVMDNHHYLIAYWFVALAACLAAEPREPGPHVARSARLLVGLAMGFAVLAKLRSGEFANGDFFEFLLLAGDRFDAFSTLVLRLPGEQLAANRAAVAALITPGLQAELVTEVALQGAERVRVAALLLAWWTLAIESVAAAVFLWPGSGRRLRAARHATLLAFAVTTYAIATVGAFAWILLILGAAQCEEDERLPRAAYTGAFLLVLLYALPWGDALRGVGLGA
jgi:hypothetical protein